MSVKHLHWALLLCACVFLVGCAAAQPAWSPSPHRSAELPTEGAALVALADERLSDRPLTPESADRALAALETLDGAEGVEGYERDWRIGRAAFHLADLVSVEATQQRYYTLGADHAKRAIAAKEDRVEGHYYLALNLAKEVEATSDVDRIGPMLEVAKRAVEIDAAFDDAGPLRLIGKVYMVAPEWPTSVGDRDEAVEVLKKAVSVAPTPLNRLFLGQAFFHIDEHERAIPHVRRALKAGAKGALEARWVEEARSYLMRMGASE